MGWDGMYPRPLLRLEHLAVLIIELRFSDLIPLYKSVGESVCSCCRSGGRRTGGIQDHSVSLKLFPIFPGQGHVREIANIPQISKDSLFGTNSGVGEKS